MVLELDPAKLLQDLLEQKRAIDSRIAEVRRVLSQPLPLDGVVQGKPSGRSSGYKVLDGIRLVTEDGALKMTPNDLVQTLLDRGLVAGKSFSHAKANVMRSIALSKGAAEIVDGMVHYYPTRKSRVGKNHFS